MHKSYTQKILMEMDFILRIDFASDLPELLLGLATQRKCSSEVV